MAEFNLMMLLEMLQEITNKEVNQRSLCHFLLLKDHTAKRLFYGYTPWQDAGNTTWLKNAHKCIDEYEEDYEVRRKAILEKNSRSTLTPDEKTQLIKEFNQSLTVQYKGAGIHHLLDCCYFHEDKDEMIFSFEHRLTNLTELALNDAEAFQSLSGKDAVLNYLRGRDGLEYEIAQIEAMDKEDYQGMAQFLVSRAKPDREKVDAKSKAPADKSEPDSLQLLRYEDLKRLGLTAWDIACNLVENDHMIYPDIAPENEADAGLWKEYLSRYPDTFAYLVDPNKRIVGNWSFVSITEEQEQLMEAGELIEDTFNVQNTECLFLPGDYVLYLLNLSCNEEFAKPQYYQVLIDELWRQMLTYAKNGIYFKRFCINVFHPVYEALWRSMGFEFIVDNCFSGRIYAQKMVPFPATLKAKDPAVLSELKKVYDEHFAV